MKTNLNSIWKFVVGGGTVLGYQAFYDRMSNKKNALKTNEMIKNIDEDIKIIKENISKCDNSIDRDILLAKQQELQNNLKNLADINSKFIEKHEGLTKNSEESINLFNKYKDDFTKAFEQTKNSNENLEKSINNATKSFFNNDNNSITDKINEYRDFLSNLSTTEICLVINITSCLLILSCLITVTLAVYGNFIINKLDLENKYPKLAFFIKLRVKLQHSYILTNILIIVIALVAMIIINYITLTGF